MKKPLIILVITILVIIAFFVLRQQKIASLEKKYKDDIIQLIKTDLEDDIASFKRDQIESEPLLHYPDMKLYVELDFMKDKFLSEENKKDIKSQEYQTCTDLSNVFQNHLNDASSFEKKIFYNLIKKDNVKVSYLYRNAYGETLYTEQHVLSQCPEFPKSV